MFIAKLHASLLVTVLVLTSCEHQQLQPTQKAATEVPGKHWMQGQRLKTVMGQVAGLHDLFPKGLPEDVESPKGLEARRALSETAALADALAETATAIPTTVANKPMSETDRKAFAGEALRLHDQAITLRNAARANQIEPLQGMMDGINSTCISCHSKFRDLTGELNSHKASIERVNRDAITLNKILQ